MQSQIEIASPPSNSFEEARDYLARLRSGIAEVACSHGILLRASGTHPLARWIAQSTTEKTRYETVTNEMQKHEDAEIFIKDERIRTGLMTTTAAGVATVDQFSILRVRLADANER